MEYIELERCYRKVMGSPDISDISPGSIRTVAEIIEKIAPGKGAECALQLARTGPVNIGDADRALKNLKHRWLLEFCTEPAEMLARIAGYSSAASVSQTLFVLRKKRKAAAKRNQVLPAQQQARQQGRI